MIENVSLNVRLCDMSKALAVQLRHPVFLSWHTVATFDEAGPVPYHHAKTYAQALAQSAGTWPVDKTSKLSA